MLKLYEYYDDGSSDFYQYLHEHNYIEPISYFYKENHLNTFVIQGEFCAPGIQKNHLKLAKPEWYVFTINIDGRRINLDRMIEICRCLNLKSVPIEERGIDLPSIYPNIETLLQRADGEYPNGGKKEGIVIRPTSSIYSPLISSNLSTKVINNKYLLKNDD